MAEEELPSEAGFGDIEKKFLCSHCKYGFVQTTYISKRTYSEDEPWKEELPYKKAMQARCLRFLSDEGFPVVGLVVRCTHFEPLAKNITRRD